MEVFVTLSFCHLVTVDVDDKKTTEVAICME